MTLTHNDVIKFIHRVLVCVLYIFRYFVFHEISKSRIYSQNMYFVEKYLPFTETQNIF